MNTNQTQTDDDRLWDALARWEEAFQQGRDLPAEELCRDCPEILDQLKDRIWALKRTAWMMRPTADEADAAPQDASDLTLKALGDYDLLERIGIGGMGHVYKAVHRKMQRVVTVKLLPRSSPQSAVWFQDEVVAAAKLCHPNTVMAFDADESDGIPFLVMEYIDGTDLNRLVQEQGPLPVERAVNYVLQAAKGLDFAHGEGIIHRDVKPANLLLGKDGTVKILDVGLARIRASQSQAAVGTPDFLAPEVALDPSKADARSDIYALGCTLWFLLTGKPLFEGGTIIQKILAHRELPVPSLRKARPDVPDALDATFRKMVAKRPEDRFGSAGELVAALRALQQPRSRRFAWLLGLVFLTAVVPLAAWFVVQERDKATATEGSRATSPVNDPTQDRRVAEMVLGRRGNVTITAKRKLAKVTDAAQLPAEPFRLREIDLISTEVKDADLESIHGLHELSALRLNQTLISDAGFIHLNDLPALRLLEVVETRITDDGLKHLADLPSVTWLTLQSTFVTDAGLPHLKALPNLRELRLSHLPITDQGLVHLQGLTGLRLLEVYETGVTDAGMASVKKLKNLTWLNLVGTKLTDTGLAELKELEGLRNLSVARTKVTDAGVRSFQQARPFCKVYRD
jgi:hypothetical protein